MPTYAETLLTDDSLEMDFYHKMCSFGRRYVLKYLYANNNATFLATKTVCRSPNQLAY